MSVDRELVARIADLARLRFEPEELERLTDELNEILAHVEVLRELTGADRREVGRGAGDWDARGRHLASTRPTEDAEPDEPGAGPESLAPRWGDGFFLVPPPPGVHDTGEGP